ncbi:MAG: hypothetical protein U9O96_08560 [Candidatus Thermoplasmatota archaeon]|nr:hypothetical protein [Candidatus Thermoplasmatota archaeon]
MLSSRGYAIVALNHRIDSGGENIAEIDILAEKDGDMYAIEVKSGRANLTAVRQIYANAKLGGYKPLLICKKSDESTREAAKQLGVKIMEFSEYHLLLEPEELESIVKECMEEVMEEYGFLPYALNLSKKDIKVLKAIASAKDFAHAADMLKLDGDALGKKLASLSRKGVLPSRSLSFNDLKRCSSSILSRNELLERLERIESEIKKIRDFIKNS